MAYFTLASLVPVLLIGYTLIRNSDALLRHEIKMRLESVANGSVSSIRLFLDGANEEFNERSYYWPPFAEQVGAMVSESDTQKRDFLRNELIQMLSKTRHFSEFLVADGATGRVLLSTNPIHERKSVAQEDFFLKGREQVTVGRFGNIPSLDEEGILLSAPLRAPDGSFSGVIVAHLNLQFVYGLMFTESSNVTLGESGRIHLVDENRKMILETNQPDHGLASAPPSTAPQILETLSKPLFTDGVNRALRGEKGTSIYRNHLGIEVIGYFQYFPEYGFVLLIEQSTQEAFAPLKRMKTVFALATLDVALIDLILALFIHRRIAKPLFRLARTAEEISDGNYETFAEMDTRDEFGLLAKALNSMSSTLLMTLDKDQSIIETMPSALFILDSSGRIRTVNRRTLELTEYEKGELVGKPFKNLILSAKGDDRRTESFDFGDLKKEGRIFDLQTACFTKFHHICPVALSAVALKGNDGKSPDYIVVLKDLREIKKYAKSRVEEITPYLDRFSVGDFSKQIKLPPQEDEFTNLVVSTNQMAENLKRLMSENRKRTVQLENSQNRLETSHKELESAAEKTAQEKARVEALLESIGDGIIALDLRGRILMMNQASERMFGKPLDDTLGKHYSKVFEFKDDKGRPIDSDIFSVEGVVVADRKVVWFSSAKTPKIPLSITVSSIFLSGKSIGNVVTFRDITKELEIDKAKSEFVSLASHQLRTPLTGIKWLIQEIRRMGKLSDLQTEYLDDTFRSNERMISLVNDLLNVSRLETGAIKALSVPVDLFQFLNDFVKEASFITRDRGHVLEFSMPNPKVKVTLDPQLIGQVVTSLLSNSIRYTDSGKKISISAEQKGDKVILRVSDEGIGISKEDQKKMFAKFFRSKEASKRSTNGSGLGLYIVSKILDVCSGTIECQSEEGKGSTFIVTLPLEGPVNKASDKVLILKKLFTPLQK